MDFLKKYCCVVDIPNALLQFTQWHISVPLNDERESAPGPTISIVQNLQVPPRSEMEVPTQINVAKEVDGTWLIESRTLRRSGLIVARALVQPKDGKIPVRILNLSSCPVTIYKGTRIATLEKPQWDTYSHFRETTMGISCGNNGN